MNTKYTNVELKPCPFCGEEAEIALTRDYAYVYCHRCMAASRESNIKNHNSDMSAMIKTAADSWNKRHPNINNLISNLDKIERELDMYKSRIYELESIIDANTPSPNNYNLTEEETNG